MAGIRAQGNNTVKQIKATGSDVKMVVANDVVVWSKPHGITIKLAPIGILKSHYFDLNLEGINTLSFNGKGSDHPDNYDIDCRLYTNSGNFAESDLVDADGGNTNLPITGKSVARFYRYATGSQESVSSDLAGWVNVTINGKVLKLIW
jgi:hypothetical protein